MANDVVVAKSAFYAVKPNTPIALSVTIGDGQVGGTVVTFRGEAIGSGEAIKDLRIPKENDPNQDLKRDSVSCTTTVRRENPATSHTSVTYALRGGVEDHDFTYDATVNQVGDRAVYRVSFIFS